MTEVAPTIDLGVVGAPEQPRGDRTWTGLRRPVIAAGVALACLLALTGSARVQQTVLGEPLWAGEVSLNGFTFGAHNIFLAAPDGRSVASRDPSTGRLQWSLAVAELPDTTVDLGGGVAAVMTRRVTDDTAASFPGKPGETTALVRADTGERLAQVPGYVHGPSVPGQPAVVLSDRPRTADGCTDPQTSCVDLTGWRVSDGKATPAWRVSLPPGSGVLPGVSDGHIDGLLEMDPGGIMQLREVATGKIVGGTGYLAEKGWPDTQELVLPRAVVIAHRDSRDTVVTALRRPRLDEMWSRRIPTAALDNTVQFSGLYYLSDCALMVCLHIDGRTTQFIDLATGSSTAPVEADVFRPLPAGPFVASAATFDPSLRGPGVYLVSPTAKIIAEFPGQEVVDWADSGGRVLLRQSGRDRTGFLVLDEHGDAHNIGSVTGSTLTCHARFDTLACGDRSGQLRVWRLPP